SASSVEGLLSQDIRVYGCLEHRDQSSDCFGGFGRNPSRCSTHSSGSDTRLGLGPDARRAWEYTGSFPRAETAKRRKSANSVCSLLMRPDPPHWLTSDSRWSCIVCESTSSKYGTSCPSLRSVLCSSRSCQKASILVTTTASGVDILPCFPETPLPCSDCLSTVTSASTRSPWAFSGPSCSIPFVFARRRFSGKMKGSRTRTMAFDDRRCCWLLAV